MQVSTISMLCLVLLSLILGAALLVSRKSPGLALHILRGLLAIISLCALTCFYIYQYQLPIIQALDRSFVTAEISPYEQELAAARQELAANKDKGLLMLRALAEDLSWTKKRDRLHPIREEALRQLSLAYAAREQTEEAAAWAERLLELDPRNMDAQIHSAELLAKTKSGRKRAGRQLLELHRRFPELAKLSRAFLEYLCEEEDYAQAMQVLQRTLSRPTPVLWHCYYVSPERAPMLAEFNEVNHVLLTAERSENGELLLDFELPRRVQRLSINLPHASYNRLQKAELRYEDSAGEVRVPILNQDSPVELFQVRREADALVTDGGLYPHLIIDLPRPSAEGGARFRFTALLQETLPRPLVNFLDSAPGRRLTSAIAADPGGKELRRLELESGLSRALTYRSAQDPAVLPQPKDQRCFARWQALDSTRIQIEFDLRLLTDTESLDVIFSGLAGARLRIDKVLALQGKELGLQELAGWNSAAKDWTELSARTELRIQFAETLPGTELRILGTLR